jgi:hypothetical protein
MKPIEVAMFMSAYGSLTPPRLDPAAPGLRVRKSEKVSGRDAWLLERMLEGGVIERYWLDANDGLLLRKVRLVTLPVGRYPEQTDYADYRDVGGVKLAFDVRSDTVDARSSGELKFESIAPATIDPARFVMPRPVDAKQ